MFRWPLNKSTIPPSSETAPQPSTQGDTTQYDVVVAAQIARIVTTTHFPIHVFIDPSACYTACNLDVTYPHPKEVRPLPSPSSSFSSCAPVPRFGPSLGERSWCPRSRRQILVSAFSYLRPVFWPSCSSPATPHWDPSTLQSAWEHWAPPLRILKKSVPRPESVLAPRGQHDMFSGFLFGDGSWSFLRVGWIDTYVHEERVILQCYLMHLWPDPAVHLVM